MTREELVEALRWAQGRDTDEPPERWAEKRALLEAARHIAAHEWDYNSDRNYYECAGGCLWDDGQPSPREHEASCYVGLMAGAVREAGIGGDA